MFKKSSSVHNLYCYITGKLCNLLKSHIYMYTNRHTGRADKRLVLFLLALGLLSKLLRLLHGLHGHRWVHPASHVSCSTQPWREEEGRGKGRKQQLV